MSSPHLSVIIPAFNEQRRLVATLSSVEAYLASQPYTYEVIVADDGSTDQTIAIAEEWFGAKSNYQVLPSLRGNQGKGDAVRRGVLASTGKLVLFMDADNSVPITELPKLLAEIAQHSVAIGSKYAPGASSSGASSGRTLLSRTSNWLVRQLAVPDVLDTQCGFKLFQQTAAREIFRRMTVSRFGFDIELLVIARALKLSYREVGIAWTTNTDSRVRPVIDALRTLWELVMIVWNRRQGLYR